MVFQEIQCLLILTMTMFVMSQSFISLPSFMFFSAAVSEIHDLNHIRRIILKTAISQALTDPFFMSYLLTISTH